MVYVKKENGEIEEFDEQKFIRSLKKSGANNETIGLLLKKLRPRLRNFMSTRKIYRLAHSLLTRISFSTAVKYEIKWALMRLGKEGYPFEKFIARLLEKEGYKTKNNVIVKGRCITHEIDVVAKKGGKKIMVECKHKSIIGKQSRIKTALYIYARFLDLKGKFDGAILATNLKFSEDAKKYAKCVGLGLLGWSYPEKDSLEQLINRHKFFPITVLRSVDKKSMKKLLDQGILVTPELEIFQPEKLSAITGIRLSRAKKIIKEARNL